MPPATTKSHRLTGDHEDYEEKGRREHDGKEERWYENPEDTEKDRTKELQREHNITAHSDASSSFRATSNDSDPPSPDDLRNAEAQSSHPTPAEHFVPTRTKLTFLAGYFFLNLFLTLSNKAVLGTVRFSPPSLRAMGLPN